MRMTPSQTFPYDTFHDGEQSTHTLAINWWSLLATCKYLKEPKGEFAMTWDKGNLVHFAELLSPLLIVLLKVVLLKAKTQMLQIITQCDLCPSFSHPSFMPITHTQSASFSLFRWYLVPEKKNNRYIWFLVGNTVIKVLPNPSTSLC